MRWSRALALPVLVLLLVLAACGGSTASADGNGNGNGGEESDAPEATETQAEASQDDGGNGGNGGNGGMSEDDLVQLVEDLTPPDATETSRTTAGGVIFVTFESPRSPEELEGFYEDALADAGQDIFSRTSAEGTFSWIFGIEEGSDFGGVVSVGPSGSGSGSAVVIQVGSTSG